MDEKSVVKGFEDFHTFAKELVSKGIDISTVADLCGHADINVTRRYSKPTERDLEKAIE